MLSGTLKQIIVKPNASTSIFYNKENDFINVKYNPPEHEVSAMARNLKEVFEKKMKETFSGAGNKSDESSSDFGDSDSDDERTRKLQAIEKKVFKKLFKVEN